VLRLRQKKLLPKLIFAVFAVAVFIASYYLGNQYARPLATDTNAAVLPEPVMIRSFHLTDKNGRPFTQQSLENFWNFLIIGNLQDAGCDSLLRTYVMAWNNLAHKPELQKKTRVVFIHTGPPVKKPEQLKQAIEFYNPAFTATFGAEKEIYALGQQIGLYHEATSCNLDSSVVALISPDRYLLALFTGMTNPADIAGDLQYFN